ncbi:5-oxoprolinase subunit PxpB [Colwellia sp. KU-HH00111]|uniref:5-oxoprolinase subunit PxpB n=1 Tax=Colwellia sp. KU-HH00111 TaxID=3127652 RepID=UPI003102D24C
MTLLLDTCRFDANKVKMHIAGENALIIYFADHASSEVALQVQQAEQCIRNAMKSALSRDIIDLVPSYASIMVMFNLQSTDHHSIRNHLRALFHTLGEQAQTLADIPPPTVVELPVYYSLESGPDLALIAQRTNLSVEQIINIHQDQTYHVYAIGFAPGFAYLGEVDQRIASPRLSTPRMKVPKGAVAIADKQTAVYPNVSPGGWNIIGLCPIAMFDANARPSMPVKVGDKVKFKAISKQAFLDLSGEIPKELGAST